MLVWFGMRLVVGAWYGGMAGKSPWWVGVLVRFGMRLVVGALVWFGKSLVGGCIGMVWYEACGWCIGMVW